MITRLTWVCIFQKGKKCQRMSRPHEPITITFAGCFTAQRYRLRTCGTCIDGRCCSPSSSRTVRLRFQCPDGEAFDHNFMWIQRCRCSKSCHTHSSTMVSLYNDIHSFTHWGLAKTVHLHYQTHRRTVWEQGGDLCACSIRHKPGNTLACTLNVLPRWRQFAQTRGVINS